MSISITERRQIENEMIFRRINEKVGSDLDALDAMYIEDGDTHLVSDPSLLLRFKCECSDENCDERIVMKLSDYRDIHIDRDTFIVLPNHQIDSIEVIVKSSPHFTVVKKNNSTAEPNDILKDTSSDDTSAH